MHFLIPLAVFLGLAIAAPAGSPKPSLSVRDDDDDKGGPLGIGSDDGVLGTKLLNDDGLNVVNDGHLLGIGGDDGLLNTGIGGKEDDGGDGDSDSDDEDDDDEDN
ncbi:hypothetical protein ASPWEDRAFT_177582 [Aspergillus wentii DTO 134E9]|uniref:Uncharacterized protein n=1 Tax=Aspergillus wentii DTO 134E9 TaxID=1073089 RepID=A0A1L9R4K5_ASPWE|nr:uncharacterized protein ASPWEDRAFT_177582 [Aspergillus wentii DTO 134E9]KAI9927121.1 hypothetical protein MW887_003504 [Aspergillus wentii]OJJ29846.1 hypothetical protein ASPWEDRAFT_177582 [Aspergillus wentii DTO 134E9]